MTIPAARPPTVVYLATPRDESSTLFAYTFLDEEILALADAGVRALVISPYDPTPCAHENVEVFSLPRGGAAARLDGAAFVARHLAAIPARCLADPAQMLHVARIEHLAAQVARRARADLVHAHFGWPGGFGGLLAARAARVPLVGSVRGMDALVYPSIDEGLRLQPFYERAFRRHLRALDAMVCVSEYIRDEAVALGGPADDRGVVVHKGVDLDRFTPAREPSEARRELDLPDVPTVLTVAGLVRRKGVDTILRALARVERPFRFLVCGDGPEHARLEDLARSLGIAGRTAFTGAVDRDRIATYFAACDVFVLGSVQEASGNVLCEAMASGRPVVCTASGGPPEYVADQETGLVVPPLDPEAMARAIDRLLADPDAARAMGGRGRARAEQRFAFARMTGDLLAVYERVLSEGPGRMRREKSCPRNQPAQKIVVSRKSQPSKSQRNSGNTL